MFFFDDPFDYDPLEDYFNYRYNRRRRQPQVRRNPYYDPIEDRLNQVLREEFGLDPYYNIDIERRARQLQHQRDLDSQDHSETKERIEDEVRRDRGEDIPQQPPQSHRPQPPQRAYQHQPPKTYFYSSSSSYDGKNYVEEHREKVTDADGMTHQTTRRRLGDRWYQAESTTDKDGKTTSRETWHNVPEDQTEQFKAEWTQQHDQKYALTHDDKQENKQ